MGHMAENAGGDQVLRGMVIVIIIRVMDFVFSVSESAESAGVIITLERLLTCRAIYSIRNRRGRLIRAKGSAFHG